MNLQSAVIISLKERYDLWEAVLATILVPKWEGQALRKTVFEEDDRAGALKTHDVTLASRSVVSCSEGSGSS